MKKQIILICEGSQQFGMMIDEMSISKVVKQIIMDLSSPTKDFICLADYTNQEDLNPIYVRANGGFVKAVVVAGISNIAVPNKNLIVPVGGPN